MTFSGSYAPEDVTFLLKRIDMAPTPVAEKEVLIQSGRRHYSEMISAEAPPAPPYLELFHTAMELNRGRFAADVARLALALSRRPGRETVLVSLARAGTPVGVLLRRALSALSVPCSHYSVSIIRDRGIDAAALDYILERHRAEDVVFVDGWTGKGAITRELESTVAAYNSTRATALNPGLTVVADLAGVAELASTSDDYLIPPSILNAVISGLVSRTILNSEYVEDGDFHACILYEELREHDLSRWFVDTLEEDVTRSLAAFGGEELVWDAGVRAEVRERSEGFVDEVRRRYAIGDRNRVKPGIGEATRALLRRVPERLLVKDPEAADLRHLLFLARMHEVPVELDCAMPYRAAAIIQKLGSS